MQLMPITHFNYSGFFFVVGRGSKGKQGAGNIIDSRAQISPESNLQNTTNAFYCGSQFPPSLFCCFSLFILDTQICKVEKHFCDFRPALESMKEHFKQQTAWQNSPRMK
jgi:hypothetical protein